MKKSIPGCFTCDVYHRLQRLSHYFSYHAGLLGTYYCTLQDTVDILVGWHIDPTTPYHVTCYASQSLQRLSHYWANDLDFSLTMLGHFLEDTEAYTDELLEDENKTSEEKLIKVTTFIK